MVGGWPLNRSGWVDLRPNRFHSVYRHVANYDVTAPNTVIFVIHRLEGEG